MARKSAKKKRKGMSGKSASRKGGKRGGKKK